MPVATPVDHPAFVVNLVAVLLDSLKRALVRYSE
jgi:hypothetical protein